MKIVNFNKIKTTSQRLINLWYSWNKQYCQDLNNKITSLYDYMVYNYPEYIILNSPTPLYENSTFQPFVSLLDWNIEPRLKYIYEHHVKIATNSDGTKFEERSFFTPGYLQWKQGFLNNSDFGDGYLGYFTTFGPAKAPVFETFSGDRFIEVSTQKIDSTKMVSVSFQTTTVTLGLTDIEELENGWRVCKTAIAIPPNVSTISYDLTLQDEQESSSDTSGTACDIKGTYTEATSSQPLLAWSSNIMSVSDKDSVVASSVLAFGNSAANSMYICFSEENYQDMLGRGNNPKLSGTITFTYHEQFYEFSEDKIYFHYSGYYEASKDRNPYINKDDEVVLLFKRYVIEAEDEIDGTQGTFKWLPVDNFKDLFSETIISSNNIELEINWAAKELETCDKVAIYISNSKINSLGELNFLAGYLCLKNKQNAINEFSSYLIVPLGNGGYYNLWPENANIRCQYQENDLNNFLNRFSVCLATNCRYINPAPTLSFNSAQWSFGFPSIVENQPWVADQYQNTWNGQPTIVAKTFNLNGEHVIMDSYTSISSNVWDNNLTYIFNIYASQKISLPSYFWFY